MDFWAVFRYEIPYLHPLVVHFPPVLLLAAAGAATGYALLGRSAWRIAALLLLVPGALLTWAAVQTGEALYADVEGAPEVEALIDAHHAAGEWGAWAGLAAAAAAAGATGWMRRRRGVVTPAEYPTGAPPREPLALRLLVLVPTWAATLLVLYTGHVGGAMVWGVPP